VKTAEIRNSFLKFFENKGHTIVASSSLVPAGDPTLLFANSGMVQFKDCFLGADKRAYTRATTCQKSLRISGKHNDLENVGRTARHHTFFEMLGNFSFGDYFKTDAIKFAWEFVTEVLKLPKDRLWVTIFEEDDEAEQLWQTLTDVNPERIVRRDKKDNFWAMGDTGPCGPCTEIFYYLGDEVKSQSKEEFLLDDGTYIEIWNLVFMQFNRDAQGKMSPLPKPSVDTGMGLERVAGIMQGAKANYDSDILRGLIALAEKMSGKRYDGKDYTERNTLNDSQYATDVAMRVIADHSRAASFLIADGVMPSSDGRGYVLRRLIRRACRHGRVLGFKEPFLYLAAEEVVSLMKDAYPELLTNKEKLTRTIRAEEERFIVSLENGLQLLEREIVKLKSASAKVLSGEVAFQLHDTYGFPLDLTQDIVQAHGLNVDQDGFSAEMDQQRQRSRTARATEIELILQRAVKTLPTIFKGYEYTQYESKVVGIFNADGEIKSAKAGQEVALVVAETPFYGESGGQVGDTGRISSLTASLDVIDTQKLGGETIVHLCKIVEGEISKNDSVRLEIDELRRNKIRNHHSATHLLHAALREVLGKEVKQAGSRVSDRSLRFDFTHHESLSESQLSEIEDIANELIRKNSEVETQVLPIEEAKKSGAVALFGEKYGQTVRVVKIGETSKEFCGGTHALRSGDIGSLVIDFESSVSAGVRRIEALVGSNAVKYTRQNSRTLQELALQLKSSKQELVVKIEKTLDRERELEKTVLRLQQKLNSSKGGDLLQQVTVTKNGINLLASNVEEISPEQLRQLADNLRSRLDSGAIALAGTSSGKAIFLVALTDNLVGKYHAGNLMKEIAILAGSRGGGKPDLAQAGGGDPEKITDALRRFEELIA
jgi:alanyl-tRNA synthetase